MTEEKQKTTPSVPEKKKMDAVFDSMLSVASKVGNNRQLSNLRDAFATFMPFIIMGSLALLFTSVIISPTSILAKWSGAVGPVYDNGVLVTPGNSIYEGWSQFAFYVNPIFAGITDATTNFMSVYLAFFIGYYTARSYGSEKPLFGGAVGLAVFLLMQPIAAATSMGLPANKFLGTGGLIVAIFAGLAGTTVFQKLSEIDALKIKMPDGVPPAVGNAFGSLISVAIVLLGFGLIQPIWGDIMYAAGPGANGSAINGEVYYIFNAINKYLAEPFQNLSDTLVAVFIICLFVDIFWFLGLHGSNIMNPVIYIAWVPGLINNMNVLAANGGDIAAAIDTGLLTTWNGASFAAFALVGGGGYMLALLIPMRLLTKSEANKAVSTLALPPGVFNISEPAVYGIPVMLNVVYMIPFLFVMPTIASLAFLVTSWGLMNPATAYPAWMMPGVILGPVLATADWRAGIWSVLFLAIAIAMYTPWVLLDNKLQIKQAAEEKGISVAEYKKILDENKQEAKAAKAAAKAEKNENSKK